MVTPIESLDFMKIDQTYGVFVYVSQWNLKSITGCQVVPISFDAIDAFVASGGT
jgi:hypothetical protein